MRVSVILGLVVRQVIIRTLGKETYDLSGLAANFVDYSLCRPAQRLRAEPACTRQGQSPDVGHH